MNACIPGTVPGHSRYYRVVPAQWDPNILYKTRAEADIVMDFHKSNIHSVILSKGNDFVFNGNDVFINVLGSMDL